MDARERLEDAAIDLFVRRGYDAVGVQEIVEAAGLTKPTLYHHFGSKRGLLDALSERIDRLLENRLAGIGYAGDMPRDLERLIAALLGFAATSPRETRLLLAARNAPSDSESRRAFDSLWNVLGARVEQFFAEAAADHGNMRGRERELTVALLGVIFAYVHLSLDGRLDDGPSLAHRIMRIVSYGIYT